MKQQRWYEVKGDKVFIYNSGYTEKSVSVSVISKVDLKYYRSYFTLSKVWDNGGKP